MDTDIHVFVYGTLKPGEANFDRYCRDKVTIGHRAYIDGDLYHLPTCGYPGATHGTNKIQGFVLSFKDPAILIDLDELEDYDRQRQPAENDYTRELVTTHTPDRILQLSAWAYFMTPQQIYQLNGILIPDGWWQSQTRS
jgi:gamma-glutamylcyclotransferase (GGCT)/AIG2-like uncharacterized protein YtfP